MESEEIIMMAVAGTTLLFLFKGEFVFAAVTLLLFAFIREHSSGDEQTTQTMQTHTYRWTG